MKRGKNHFVSILIPILIVLACLFLWFSTQNTGRISISGDDSVWDMRTLPFSDHVYRLSGEVEYIPNALLTPKEFELREKEAVIGYPENNAQYATSRMRILMPDDGYYAFYCQSIDFSERIYVNGEWIQDFGQPGETKETTIPNTGRITLTLKAENGVIEIIQQSANFVHREGGGHSGFSVGLPEQIRYSLKADYLGAIKLGSFFVLFIVHSILFFMLRSYRPNLYFALFCLTWFFRTGVTGTRIFSVLFPLLPWTVKFRMEYLSFPITAVLFVALLNNLFPYILHKWFRYVIYSVSALFAGLFLFEDTLFMSYSLVWSEAIYFLAVLYIAAKLTMKLRAITPEQGVFLAGVGVFLYSTVHDIFFYNNIILPPYGDLSSVSMLMFAICEAAAIFIATMREVENAKAEEQRLAVENAALDRVNRLRNSMMATVGHEIRTPLTVMSVYAQLVTKSLLKYNVDSQTTADLATISSEAKRLSDLAGGFLAISKEQETRQSQSGIDIGLIIRQISMLCKPMLLRNDNNLKTNIAEDMPLVYGNSGECTQILWNLLDNAARHTCDGTVTITAVHDSDFITVTVADTGEGIDPEILPYVFERNLSGNNDGTGLGLAICKDIIEAHGGKISIESAKRNGTVVTFTLPVMKGEAKDGNESDRFTD